MSLKRLAVAFVGALALAAVFASSAFATATTTKSNWFVVTKTPEPLASGETKSAKCSAAENFILTSEVFGAEIEIKATGLECVSGWVIKQEGEHAIATGQLKLTGTTINIPKCTISSITTNALTAKVYMESTTLYTRFQPTTGSVLATVSVTGASCPIAGNYPVEGTLFGRAGSATLSEVTNQQLTFSPTIQATAGGSLTFLEEEAQLTGEANTELVSGSAFGAYESAPVSSPASDVGESEVTEIEVPPGEERTVTIVNPNSFWNIYLEDFSIDGAGLEYTPPAFANDCIETSTILRPGKSCVIHVKNNSSSTQTGTLTVKWGAYFSFGGTLSVGIT
jgi:hypothetical protein